MLTVLSITGYIVGWRINDGIVNAILAYLRCCSSHTRSPGSVPLVGLSVPNTETANTAGLIWIFPLTFLSNAFVPDHRSSAVVAVLRGVQSHFRARASNPGTIRNPTGAPTGLLTLNNAALYTVISCVVIIATAPLAVRKYRTAARK